ncbi:MAG: hypothetical protein K8R23_18340 [Chthoniobacter sp.]|nr:hypothetical protein [Chthoniobacter sp.]
MIALDIVFVYLLCRKLSDQARQRGLSGRPLRFAVVLFYVAALVAGVLAGDKLLGGHPVIGAYLFAIPGSLAIYFTLRSKIRRFPLVPGAPEPCRRSELEGSPIEFPCLHCRAALGASASQRGRFIKCPACDQPTMIPGSHHLDE